MYGFGNTDRAFASVYGFFPCGLQMSVSGFLALYLLVKLLCAVLSAVVFLMLSLTFGSAVGFASVGGFTAIEGALYFLIPSTSVFSPLHQINIVAIANSGELIEKYRLVSPAYRGRAPVENDSRFDAGVRCHKVKQRLFRNRSLFCCFICSSTSDDGKHILISSYSSSAAISQCKSLKRSADCLLPRSS